MDQVFHRLYNHLNTVLLTQKKKNKAKRNKVRGCGFSAVIAHVVISATSFLVEKITMYSRNLHTLSNTAVYIYTHYSTGLITFALFTSQAPSSLHTRFGRF